LATYHSFKGFAVFTADNYKSHAGGGGTDHHDHTAGIDDATTPVATAGTGGKMELGAYYMNHTMILRDFPARTAWVGWAVARSITKVFIAPHAGDAALISIAGVEGSVKDDAIFCTVPI
jgi:hypothetical protein